MEVGCVSKFEFQGRISRLTMSPRAPTSILGPQNQYVMPGKHVEQDLFSVCDQTLRCLKFQLCALVGLAQALTHLVLGEQILPPFFSHQWLSYDPELTPE